MYEKSRLQKFNTYKNNRQVKKCIDYIDKKIKTYGLQGHDFYVYVVPFTDIDSSRKEILKEVIS